MVQKLLAWAQRNERHLGALVFVGGFVTDLVTFVLLDISLVNLLFAVYLIVAAVSVFLLHTLSRANRKPSLVRRILLVLLPLVAQYLIGSLLSGFLIFYTKSSVLSVSWPFIILLALIFLANEWFRKYKDKLIFLVTLLFFTTYAYAIFALPLVLHALGPWIFILSTLLAVAASSLFLYLLWRTGKERLSESLMPIIGSCLALLIVIVTSYFSGLVPPIPLTLKEGGIYHSLRHEGDKYVLTTEPSQAWWNLGPQIVHVTPGETIYAYTAIFAPIRFGTNVVHRWEWFSEREGTWVLKSTIAFPIAGGRAHGYRGYSEYSNPEPGKWRVSVETPNGQVIGQLLFSVEPVSSLPALHEETH